jgi:hypothetical protein
MAWEDPIVEEVRKVREQILEEAGGLPEYFEILKKKETEHPEKLITKEQLKSSVSKVQNARCFFKKSTAPLNWVTRSSATSCRSKI